MTPPNSLRFVHRFRSGVLGTLVIELVDHDDGSRGPGPLEYTWNGPRPPHGGERLKWTIESQRVFADRFKASFTYITADERGRTVITLFTPGERPRSVKRLFPVSGWYGIQPALHFNAAGEPYPPAP